MKGGTISLSNREWSSTSDNGETHNICNPFEQAQKNSYSIQDYLKNNNVPSPVFGEGVAFPDSLFKNTPCIEFDEAMIFDIRYDTNFFMITLKKFVRIL
ncbi:MAG: hypothetical protein L6V85_00420 [Clostridiales bacterium]|nr:MAG: hypothetical protein L6V85_00420 [Clostridiales bacterium]